MKALALAATAAVLAASPALAQSSTDGALSATASTGTFDVAVTVVPMVSIRGLDPVVLTIDPATLASNFGTTNGRTQFCVYSNVNAAGAYNVQISGNVASTDPNANPYGLRGTATNSVLPFTVGYWDNAAYNSTGDTFMRPSRVRASENTRNGQARATNVDCTNGNLGGSNASINVGVRNPVALAALADEYRGTLSVTVSVP